MEGTVGMPALLTPGAADAWWRVLNVGFVQPPVHIQQHFHIPSSFPSTNPLQINPWCLYMQSGKDLLSHLPRRAVLCKAALNMVNSAEPHPQAEDGRFISWLPSSCLVYGLKPRVWCSATARHAELPPSDLGRQLQCENEVVLINLKKKTDSISGEEEKKENLHSWLQNCSYQLRDISDSREMGKKT